MSAGEPNCKVTGQHVWGYYGVTMPGGYSKPISGPVCMECGDWKGADQFSAQCPSVFSGTPPWPMPSDSVNVSVNTSALPLGQGAAAVQQCTVPPEGWICTRGVHADGPCAAVPVTPVACQHCGHAPGPITSSVVVDQPGHPVSAVCTLTHCQHMDMPRRCLNCGGSGCLKEFENPAGDYHYVRCPECDGTGREMSERVAAKREAARIANEEYQRQRAALWQRIKAPFEKFLRWL